MRSYNFQILMITNYSAYYQLLIGVHHPPPPQVLQPFSLRMTRKCMKNSQQKIVLAMHYEIAGEEKRLIVSQQRRTTHW